MDNTFFLISIILLGFLAHSRVVVLAGFTLLLLKELKIMPPLFFLSNRGIEVGLIFLLLAILAPLILKPIDLEELKLTMLSWKGLIAVVSGLLATQLNGMGLELLSELPQLIVGIIIGSLIGIILFNGIPVGPLMAAGIAALLVWVFELMGQIRG